MSGQVVNNFSLNVFGGYTAGTNGMEIGGLFNIDKQEVKYFQAAGIFNVDGGKMKGFQVAGINNTVLDTSYGFQAAGISNLVKGKFAGFQVGGIYNHVADSVKGFQAAGIANFARRKLSGVQIAGVITDAECHNKHGRIATEIRYHCNSRCHPFGRPPNRHEISQMPSYLGTRHLRANSATGGFRLAVNRADHGSITIGECRTSARHRVERENRAHGEYRRSGAWKSPGRPAEP